MKLKTLFAMAALTAALGMSVSAADAQGRRGAAAAQGGLGNPMLMQMQMQMQMQMMGGANLIDPAQSAKAMLVYRPDVQNALGLDLKQKLALDALKDVQAQNQQKMGQDMRTLIQGTRRQAQTLSPDELQQQMQDVSDKAKGMAQGYQDDMEKRIDAILTQRQRTRLSEFDLQWRGPMALVDPKVAARAALGDEDKKKAADTYKEFTDSRQKLAFSMMPANMRNRFGAPPTGTAADPTNASAPPAAPVQPTVPLTPDEQAAAQKKALRDFEKSRIALGAKLVANVTPAAATAWQGMIGTHFTFRSDE